ncbi:MAG: hypothetical protein V3V04_06000 [Rhizobiaceae bacterium]
MATQKQSRKSTLALACIIAIQLSVASAQEPPAAVLDNGASLELQLKEAFKAGEKALVAAAIKLSQNPYEIFLTSCRFELKESRSCTKYDDRAWLLDLVPEFNIEAGADGSFQSITAKVTGNYISFTQAPIGTLAGSLQPGVDDQGRKTPDLNRFSVFPISLGMETTRYFDDVAVLAEVGYVPFGKHKLLGQSFILGLNPYVGVFLQGGHKFKVRNQVRIGNSQDESSEQPNSSIGRIKLISKFNTDIPIGLSIYDQDIKPKFNAWATGWYDFVNSETYYSIGATLKFPLPGKEETFINFTIEKGSGEPNFNKGTQFSSGLSIVY